MSALGKERLFLLQDKNVCTNTEDLKQLEMLLKKYVDNITIKVEHFVSGNLERVCDPKGLHTSTYRYCIQACSWWQGGHKSATAGMGRRTIYHYNPGEE